MGAVAQIASAETVDRRKTWRAWLPLLTLPVVIIPFRNHMPAWAFMWALCFAIFAGLKWTTWSNARNRAIGDAWRSTAYLLAWPGMDAEAFLDPTRVPASPGMTTWLWAGVKTAIGILLLWTVAPLVSSRQALLQGWIGLFGLIFLLHFGSFHLIALFWQGMGIDAQPIMAKPIQSKTLSEFWGKRWNLGFRQIAHDLIFRPLHRAVGVGAAGFFVFLASGLIHDLVISFPARGGYGLPTAYFVTQGLGVAVERWALRKGLGLDHGLVARTLALVVPSAPAFWLFHPLFVLRVIIPFMHAIHAL